MFANLEQRYRKRWVSVTSFIGVHICSMILASVLIALCIAGAMGVMEALTLFTLTIPWTALLIIDACAAGILGTYWAITWWRDEKSR